MVKLSRKSATILAVAVGALTALGTAVAIVIKNKKELEI
jgi:hypothetical protein